MKRSQLISLIILPILILGILAASHKSEKKVLSENNNSFRLIVKFDSNIANPDKLILNSEELESENIKKLLQKFEIDELYAVFRNRYDSIGNLKESKINSLTSNKLSSYRQIIIYEKSKAEKLATQLLKEKGVLLSYIEEPMHIKPFVIPNDSNYSGQWHLNSTIYPLADINAELAWDINTGRNDVIIAVCDGGIDYTHIDLDPGDRSRIIAGYDSGDDDYDPMDDLPNLAPQSFAGHGTNVAGIIGAITDNNNQVSGIMWNCKIMPVKMVGTGGLTIKSPFGSYDWDFSTTAFPSDVADAIDYAVNNGAHIINLSYGFADMGFPINEVILRIPLLHDAISNAYNNNVVIVAAMGNEYDEGNPTEYPAAFSHEVIAVGNTTPQLLRSSRSNTGPHINVSAPGTNILTTDRFTGIDFRSGTSMAAPIVSGIAGLIISQGLDRNFNLTNDDVRHILEITADDIISYGVGFDEETGYGKVNAHTALELLSEPNVLYHGVSYGGSTNVTTLSQWIYIGSRWGLAAGTYYSVDRYEVSKHINFDIPFCTIPQVWLRERDSKSMNFGNPNDGYPFAEITNITTTGFDVRFASYYVRYNSIGQTINKWVPASITSTKIEYSAVGEPNLAILAGPISGATFVCTSNSTFTLQNPPSGATITWSKSDNLTYVSGQGTSNYTVKAASSFVRSTGWIIATVNSGCEDVILEKTFWVGKPSQPITNPTGYPTYQMILGQYKTISVSSAPGASSTSYNWNVTGSIDRVSVSPARTCMVEATQLGFGNFYVTSQNICGTSITGGGAVNVTSGGGGGIVPLSVIPNPASNEIDVRIIVNSPGDDIFIQSNSTESKSPESLVEFDLSVYNNYGIKVYNAKVFCETIKINVSGWQKGLYYILMLGNDRKYTGSFIVE